MQTEELLKLAKKEKLSELESAWMSAVGEDVGDLAALLEIPRLLVERRHRDLAESLLWYLIDSLTEGGNLAEGLKAAREGGRLLPGSSVMRDLVTDLYSQVHADRADVQDLVRLTLKATDLPLDEALTGIEKLMAFRPGSYALDRQRGAVCRVEGLDTERGGLAVTFAEGTKVLGPGLLGRLEALDEDDFRALSVFESDRLTALAREDPEELMRIVLSSLDRRMQLRRLRLYLEPVVGSWTKWWSGARGKLKRSAVIGMTEGKAPSLFLRARPLSHAERLLRRFDSVDGPVARMAVALDIVREAREHGGVESESVQPVAARLSQMARQAGGEPRPVALAAAAVAEAFAAQFPGGEVPELPEAVSELLADPPALPAAVGEPSVLLCALDSVRRQAPQVWKEFFAAVMPRSGRGACEGMAARLSAAGAHEALCEARREVLASPEADPGALAWLWRDCVTERKAGEEAGVEPTAVAMRLLSMMAALVRLADIGEEERKEQIADLRNALFFRGGEPLRRVLEDAQPEQVAAIKALGERNPALTDGMRADLMDMVRKVSPVLFTKAVPPWKEPVIYTTEAGREKRRAELEEIVHERLPQIMREIGHAASFGDISDNAEYRSALVERGRLAERAARIQEELSEARPIAREMAQADHVTVGSRVRARNPSTGEVESLTFLGPWDARPEERIYAYNAPLGQAFMGRRAGDVVTFQA
ncbi:MAG: GreA/GreB family elongation factor, partial [Planctomycetota bacterium]